MKKVIFDLKEKTQARRVLIVAVLFVALGCMLRLLPHAPNFAPIGAIALFGGLYLPRRFALAIPLGAMLVGDALIGFYDVRTMIAVYASFALIVGIGFLVRRNKRVGTVVVGTLAGSCLFFLITNTAVWAFGNMYAPTLSGLIHCYFMAVPFFKNTLLSDLFYTGVLVGGFEGVLFFVRTRLCQTNV